MNDTEKNKVLRHSASAIAIPVNSLGSINDQMFPSNDRAIRFRPFSSLYQMIAGNPDSTSVQIWSKVFIFLFLCTFLSQTLGIFLQYVNQDENCIVAHYHGPLLGRILYFLLNGSFILFFMHMIFKSMVAYVDTESRVLVYDPKKVSRNYLRGYFIIDFFLALSLTPTMLGGFIKMTNWSAGLYEVLAFLQYLALLCRLLSLFSDHPRIAFFFESWSSKFVLNLLAFFLFSHVVGSFWYFFALHRVNKCLEEACGEPWCLEFTFCGPIYKNDSRSWTKWKKNDNATACFGPGGFDYGIYEQAVGLMKISSPPMRYIYSLYWGFQQISTLAGNQTPAFFHVEVLFTMFITATGLLLFSFLIGNMQNFLQARGRRSLEKSVRGLDVEQWMSHRQLPKELKTKIRESEQYNWLATRGVNELMLLENLPEDLQRDIRRHLFKFDKKIPLVAVMDESILDAIRERMKQKTYIKGSRILVCGGLISNMVFIDQGKVESIRENEDVVLLSKGDVCGEELVKLCLEHYVLNRDGEKFKIPAQKLVSKRMVRCLTNVEAFTLTAADLEEVFSFYSGLLVKNPLLQGAIKKESLYPKSLSRSRSF